MTTTEKKYPEEGRMVFLELDALLAQEEGVS
jgi:hypothetical protein